VRQGEWRLAVPIERMRTLRELTVGIVGFGRIGRAVAQRLVPFGCRLLAYDPAVGDAEVTAAGATTRPLEALLAESDLITLHCPATAATRGMIDAAAIARMKPGVIVVNLARGAIVDSAALVDGLQRGHISAAALDVFDPEPIPPGHALFAMPNVVVAAHISSASPKAARRLRETVAGIVACCVRGEPLPNIVNGATAK